MLQLRQLDLQFSLAGPGALGKDVKNKSSAVQDFASEDLFEIAALRGGEFVVEDRRVDIILAAESSVFGGLAGANKGSCHRGLKLLHAVADDFGSGGSG